MYYDMDMVQISDGLSHTSACASAAVYDKANGLMFVTYMTGHRKSYGESTGKICLSVFCPSQPHNVRHRIIDTGIGESQGLLCFAHYLIGDGKTRIMFTTSRGEPGAYYRDYDFFNDTISERKDVFLRIDEKDVPLNKDAYKEFLDKNGLPMEKAINPIVNNVTTYNGEFYTSVTCHGVGYTILCKIKENVLEPFATHPEMTTFEFRYYINDDGIFAVYRIPPNDHGTGHGAFTKSSDGGKTWNTTVYADGVQSRPDIIEYYGKPMFIYNYKSDKSIENFPPVHNFRNAVKIVYDGEVVFDWFTKYGVVEPELVNICGDIYMVFSNSPQALSTENRSAWEEDGRRVEQGKEVIQWAKLGYLAGKNK